VLRTQIASQYQVEVVEDHELILKYLHLGISIPVLPEFHKYILGALEAYSAKALFLREEIDEPIFESTVNDIVGITVIYDDGRDTLFFGFCGVMDHCVDKIELLVKALIYHAKENNYRFIRGPVNIPAVIYGWGFMVAGSNQQLFIGCPVNPPIYQETFLNQGFYVKFEEDRYDVIGLRMDPHKIKDRDGKPRYDFSDYEFINPTKDNIPEVIDEFIRLHVEYMPPSAQISPYHRHNAESHLTFIHEFGVEEMIWYVMHKPTNEMVACGYILPNVFSRTKQGKLDSASFHDWVVHPDHRRAGLAMFMYGETSLRVVPKHVKWGSWPVGADNEANAAAARKMGGKRDRRHLILELEL
jgi:hypothetical protein